MSLCDISLFKAMNIQARCARLRKTLQNSGRQTRGLLYSRRKVHTILSLIWSHTYKAGTTNIYIDVAISKFDDFELSNF